MKKFTLMMMAGLFALAANAQQKTVITAADVVPGEDGIAEIVLTMSYPTTEQVSGYNFNFALPEGVKGANAKTGKETGSGKVTGASITLGSDIHPLVWDAEEEDYTKDPKDALTVQERSDGNVLIIWIDQKMKTPLKATEGQLMTIKVKAAEGFTSGEGRIYEVALSNTSDVSLDGGNIADTTFTIGGGEGDGINDIQAADATAPAYNLQGVRVNSAAKGVIIRDGKKMVVK